MKRNILGFFIVMVGLVFISCPNPATDTPADTVINISAISVVTAPVYGATPVTTITETSQYTGTVAWNGSPTTFAASTVYTATITLTAKNGYTLTGIAADFFTVAGTTSDTNPVNSGVITAVFPATGSSTPSNLSYSNENANYAQGVAIANNTPEVTGTVTSYSVSPALPSGLIINTVTGVISGTPTTVSAIAVYTITASNADGSTTKGISITVIASNTPPSNLSYANINCSYVKDITITMNGPTVTGTVTNYSISPALPVGLSMNSTTGIISGIPTTTSSANGYEITASNEYGNTIAMIAIEVVATAGAAVTGTITLPNSVTGKWWAVYLDQDTNVNAYNKSAYGFSNGESFTYSFENVQTGLWYLRVHVSMNSQYVGFEQAVIGDYVTNIDVSITVSNVNPIAQDLTCVVKQ